MDKYIGIGELELPDTYKLPPLHVLIDSDYNIINLEFMVCSYGNSITDAMHSMRELLIKHVDYSIEKLGYDNLVAVARHNSTSEEWGVYSELLFRAAHQCEVTTIDRASKASYTLARAA